MTLPDICESLLLDVAEYQKKAQIEELKFEQKKYWKAFLADSRKLSKVVRSLPEEYQYSYAETCEAIETLLLKAIDRVGNDDLDLIHKFIKYIESFPSKRNIEFKN